MIHGINRCVSFCIVLIVLASCAKENKISSDQADQFIKFFGGSDVDKATAVVECSDGGFALTGTMSVGDNKNKAFFIRTDKYGNELIWSPVLFGDTLKSIGNSVITLADGFLVVGSTNVLTNNILNIDVQISKIGNDGSITWQKKFGGSLNDEAYCAIETNAGYLIGGYTKSKGKGGKDAWALMLDNKGNTIWEQTQGGSKDDCYKSIIETDNSYILIGSTESFYIGSFNRSVFFVKIDKSTTTGDPFDFAFYGGLSIDSKIDVIKDVANNIIVMRNIQNSDVSNIVLLKVRDDFHQVVWEKNISKTNDIGTAANEIGNSLIIQNNQIVVVGNSILNSNSITNIKFLLKTISLEGDIISSILESGISNQLVNDGIVSSDGHIVIVGSNSIDSYSKISLQKIK